MNKKLDMFIRVLAIVTGLASIALAFLLKGKIEFALTKTEWAVTDPEVKAGKEFEARMTSLASLPNVLNEKRQSITTLELAKKDLSADVAEKKNQIAELTTEKTKLEGERTELTRKRDELAAEFTEAKAKMDTAIEESTKSKEALVAATEKIATMYTKDELTALQAQVDKATGLAEVLRQKYAKLHTWASNSAETPTPGGFSRDPLAESSKETAVASGSTPATEDVVITPQTSNITKIVALDKRTGVIAFSVGQSNGIKEKSILSIKVAGKDVGRVQIQSVKNSISYGQLQPSSEKVILDITAISKAAHVTLEAPAPNKLASN